MSDRDELLLRLATLAERIEGIALDPAPAPSLLVRLLGRSFDEPGKRAGFGTGRMRALLAGIKASRPKLPVELGKLAAEAVDELERNVEAVESIRANGRAPIGHAAWLGRLHGVVASGVAAALATGDGDARRLAGALDPTLALAPLLPRSRTGGARANQRPFEIELAAIDLVLDAARRETQFLGRRRRLFEAARRILLAASAALPLDPSAVDARRSLIAEGIVRVDRVQAAGVDPDVALLHQARTALGRGELDRLFAALVAIDGGAVATRDARVSSRTRVAIERCRSYAEALDPAGADAADASLQTSARQLFGDRVVGAVTDAYAKARRATPAGDEGIKKAAERYFETGGERACLASMAAGDGWLEVGGALSPVRISETVKSSRIASTPTREIAFAPIADPSDLPNAVIEDPRTLLLSLAEGTLLSRKYLLHEETRRERTVRVGEVRVYVLDGSGSMLLFGSGGARARMRDAVLLAELATMARRLRDRRVHRAVLFYRYFDTTVGPITRIDSEELAHAAISEVVGTVRTGGTDIETALLASFAQIGEARATDPDLGRGHIVLVTDGDAAVDEARIEEARRAVEIPVGLSVIALGMENPTLRQLVARQHADGARAFYHYLSDDELVATAGGRVDRGLALHLVHATSKEAPSPRQRAEALEALLGELLEELGAIEHERQAAAVELDVEEAGRAEATRASMIELGVDPGPRAEGDRARREAIERDHRGLQIRFDRWFPVVGGDDPSAPPVDESTTPPAEGTPERDDLAAALVALEAVAEVVALVGGSGYARRADAIGLIERLLPEATLSPTRYEAVLRDHAAAVAPALRAVREAAHEPRAEEGATAG